MTDIVLLNNIDHANLRVARGYGEAFGDAVNQVLVFPTEFEALQREYPILFRRDEAGALQAVALLGLDRNENLYLDGETWQARYVPAIQRRGPFSIGLSSARGAVDAPPPELKIPDLKINVDLHHPRVVTGEGDAVFRRHGGATPYLEDVSRALSAIYEGLNLMGPMFEAFSTEGLIEPVAIDVTVGEGRRYDLEDVYAIRHDTLSALSGAALERLHRTGWLALAFHAASSVANLDRLVEMKNLKEGWL